METSFWVRLILALVSVLLSQKGQAMLTSKLLQRHEDRFDNI